MAFYDYTYLGGVSSGYLEIRGKVLVEKDFKMLNDDFDLGFN